VPGHADQVDTRSSDSPEIARVITSAKLADLRGDELLYIRGFHGNAGALFRLDLSHCRTGTSLSN
jgi:hypothetical protein